MPTAPSHGRLTGLNHLTLACTDLERSVDFYARVLGMPLAARWTRGAYLQCGELWLCLSLDASAGIAARGDYSHCAFSIPQEDFAPFCQWLRDAGVREWSVNASEGDSFYFLDPDGHRLEAHVGNLTTRLAACRTDPYDGMAFFS